MPHRRGLGEQAADQRAETELGRLVLRGTIDATLGLAGETYLALWRGYVMSIAGPAELGHGGGHGFTCDGCWTDEARRWCRCSLRARVYQEAERALLAMGPHVSVATTCLVVHDLRPADDLQEKLAATGLMALAMHFGLQRRRTAVLGNAASDTVSPPAP